MTIPTINLRQQKPDRLRHPWVYDNEIATLPKGEFENGDIVQAKDSVGCVQGLGFLNMNSKISFRYLSRNPNVVIDEAFWQNRV